MAEGESSAVGDPDANKAIIGRCPERWNTGNLAIADEIFGADFVNHDPDNPEITNLESYKGYIAAIRTGFPDFHVTTEDLIAEEDKVAERWTIDIGGGATVSGMTIHRFADGKIVEKWWTKNLLDMLQKRGMIPPLG